MVECFLRCGFSHAVKWLKNILTGIEARLNMFEPCYLGTDHLTWRGGLWLFVSFRIFFSDNTRVWIFFFCRAKREIFFQYLTLGYMTKTLNQIIFFGVQILRADRTNGYFYGIQQFEMEEVEYSYAYVWISSKQSWTIAIRYEDIFSQSKNEYKSKKANYISVS